MKFFNLDLHVAVIADLKQIFTELGHEVTDLEHLGSHLGIWPPARSRGCGKRAYVEADQPGDVRYLLRAVPTRVKCV